MKTNSPYIFLIADDHSIVRNGLAMLIKSTFDSAILYQAADFEEILNQVTAIPIHLLVLDINFPEGNTLQLLPKLKEIRPEMKIAIFTSYEEDSYALRYIKAGADAYLSKLLNPQEIQNALQKILQEGRFLNTSLQKKLLDSITLNKPINPLETLSDREMEIALLLVKGYGNLEISNELDLKPTTVSTYKNRLFEKLGVKNIPELIHRVSIFHDTM